MNAFILSLGAMPKFNLGGETFYDTKEIFSKHNLGRDVARYCEPGDWHKSKKRFYMNARGVVALGFGKKTAQVIDFIYASMGVPSKRLTDPIPQPSQPMSFAPPQLPQMPSMPYLSPIQTWIAPVALDVEEFLTPEEGDSFSSHVHGSEGTSSNDEEDAFAHDYQAQFGEPSFYPAPSYAVSMYSSGSKRPLDVVGALDQPVGKVARYY
jgi:hypothetical protein